ncbi:MAG TPA: CU044_5270 family protein [Solirubrobacterales bacterium]|jgi:hypothetical protein|nr:CU044_5270 family protein [Solirubrobacterales bacterium]
MDELELIRGHRLGEAETEQASWRAARVALDARMQSTPPASGRWPRRLARPRGAAGSPRWRLLALGACVAGLALALVIGLSGGGGQVEHAAAAQVLRRAARAASEQVPVMPGPHQYLYIHSTGAHLLTESGWSVMVPAEREDWISLDGSRKGRLRESAGRAYFLSAGQRAGWLAAGSPPLPREGTKESTVSGGGGVAEPADLPDDPAALRAGIEDGTLLGPHHPRDEVEAFDAIGELLGQASLPAAERSALFEAAAELPDIESLGEVDDPLGRPGIGIAITDSAAATRHELVVDPGTSALLAQRETTTARRHGGFTIPVGTTIGWDANLEARVVDSVGGDATAGAGSFDDNIGCYESASLHASVAILNSREPIATCERLWHEGAIGTRLRRLEEEGKLEADPDRSRPHLVACTKDGTPAYVFPGAGPALCARLGLVSLDLEAWKAGE